MFVVTVARAVLAGWWIVMATTALGAGAALLVTNATTPVYRASTSFYVSVTGQDALSAGEIAQGSTAAQQKITSYIALVSSPRVLRPVVERLGLHTTVADLGSRVSATTRTGTVIIVITANDPDARAAKTLASAVGSSLAEVVSDIEPAAASGMASVTLEPVMPATVPTTPSSPRPAADLALGIGAGLAAGVLLALVRAAVDTRVRTAEDLDVDVPVVGDVAFDPDVERRPLIVRDDGSSARSEAFRSLRTNIQFLRSGGAPTIAVTSARQAEGKTTTVANLGIAMSTGGLRTVIVDADLRRPAMAQTMGLEGAAGLTDVLVARAELEDVLQPWGDDGLHVLPAGTVPPNPSELIGSEAMERVIAELARRFDVVLVDTPPVLAVTDAALMSTLVSTTLIVVAANQGRRSDARAVVEALARVGEHADGIVLTKTRHAISRRSYYRSEYGARRTTEPAR
ncbi:capsular exopolysaccharide synthesis family protein [Curtobacterium sp. PhB130]|uniref:polysaccharide biosynthesis tyrosine autokinase n=1 Tax=unclassified Curtobacterium TaxID=257496 RepID=UPI000F4C006D|nr:MULTISPECIES: polysaccharide biosynthesis tyrosine autokinase [unclassified Curtobacterium]ROS78281.1 capsular exopolysaccharide synthesis family protein [Curtobacterium sp. PhB130]TCK65402.1 capsular exopolysaccharide synthesis family protein [Curtobacterium sp. PhB136]